MSGKERTFAEGSTLISVTDLQGVIKYCNRDFIDISGYSEKELIGSHHNIVRHKDMPKAAFEDLWTTIKSNNPWQGMVKNRCKNGDYYWVYAYITPVFENGQKVGYQSIRSCPTAKQISDAESLYKTLNLNPSRKLPKPNFFKKMTIAAKVNTLIALSFLSFLLLRWQAGNLFDFNGWDVLTNLWIIALFGTLLWLINNNVLSRITGLDKTLKQISSGNLTDNIRVSDYDEIGQVAMSAKMLQGRLKAVIGQFDESVQDLAMVANVLSKATRETKASMDRQNSETELVATAMDEMSSTVSEVARNSSRTSELASQADTIANDGNKTVAATRKTILELSDDITHISKAINSLADECEQIIDITDAISSIADQTNLLALNAAIEAARAGEHGRGFAVVADEVRVLSSRTQDATVQISTMIERLQNGSKNSVSAMNKGLEKVRNSVEQIESTADAFSRIAGSVTDVNDMNMQIATAAEEQSSVAEEMNTNVSSIREQSYKTSNNVLMVEEKIADLNEMSASLQLQLSQYNLGIQRKK